MRSRKEEGYRDTNSKDGGISPKIPAKTATRVINYCKRMNINKTQFIVQCINDKLDVLERDFYNSMTKDELIDLIVGK